MLSDIQDQLFMAVLIKGLNAGQSGSSRVQT
jgi:hypothetical protein